MQEVIAFAYSWSPDELDDLTFDRLEIWETRAKHKIEFMAKFGPLIG